MVVLRVLAPQMEPAMQLLKAAISLAEVSCDFFWALLPFAHRMLLLG